ncbi:methyltransferase (DUF5641) [Popillia japonica]|uniref:Methyltransferase (DUF5641) n=1 Tax=Popillia japonica TaxID=7064 RepID=A0AAW1JXN4_POPJA
MSKVTGSISVEELHKANLCLMKLAQKESFGSNRNQQRLKWKNYSPELLKLGSLVVLKDENLPPLKWQLGRISELHPGTEGITRVASVRLPNGHVVKRCNLEGSQNFIQEPKA